MTLITEEKLKVLEEKLKKEGFRKKETCNINNLSKYITKNLNLILGSDTYDMEQMRIIPDLEYPYYSIYIKFQRKD